MSNGLILTGFCDSVYTWIVRMALAVLGASYTYREADPFTEKGYTTLIEGGHSFGRVPLLKHGDFILYETAAITAYLNEICGGHLSGRRAVQMARIRQITGLVDGYAYWPLVRQVFSHGVYRPRIGETADPGEIRAGIKAALPVLKALEDLAREGLVLNGRDVTLADLHLAPMICYFSLYPEGARILEQYTNLSRWFAWFQDRESYISTRPGVI